MAAGSPSTRAGPGWRGYGVAVALSLLMLATRLTLEPILHGQAPFSILLAAPILAAWYAGAGPGLLAMVLCALGAQLLFVPPERSLLYTNSDEWLKMAIFVGIGGLSIWLIATRRRALRRLQGEHEALLAAQAESAAREQRALDTLEASPSGMLVLDAAGIIRSVNREAERLFGYAREELVGIAFGALVPAAEQAAQAEFHQQYQRQARPLTRELRGRRKDGSAFDALVGLNPLQGESRGLVLASVLDLSQQRRAEAALRRSEHQMQKLLQTDLLGIMFWRMDRRVVDANDEMLRIWGRTRAELRDPGLWLDQLTPTEYAAQDEEWLRQLRTTGTAPVAEKQYLRSDGSRVWVLVGSAMTGDAEGVAFVLDVSARKEAELALEGNAALFQSLADNIAQLAWMTDASGYITWYNRRWFEYTGTTHEQMKGWRWQAVHHPEHVDRVVTKFRHHIASGVPWEDTFPLRGGDGQYRWFLSRAFPLHDQAGRIMAWFGTNTDIDAQRRAEEALRDADRRKDEFIAVLAHELRNPLAPVRNAVEILKRLEIAEPRLDRVRAVIDRQVAHMARLIDDLLDVGRIARGKLTLRKEPCDVGDIVCKTADDYRATLAQAQQELRVHGCEVPAWVDGDPVRIAQMVGNLLTNAARFCDGPGTVTVQTQAAADDGVVRIVVTDTGLGIDPELLARLFDPFAQATQDMARSKGGLGLGLALTRGLAELHGGSVLAESDGPGRGARFTITLPLAHAGRQPRHPPLVHANGEPLRVVVIEDNPDAAATLGELLQLTGHQVDLAYDGASGVDLARRMHPDVVISDIGLPGAMSGYDVGRTLRSDAELDGVYLIALSGYADQAARHRAADAGFDTHLAKPPDITALESALAAVKARSTADS